MISNAQPDEDRDGLHHKTARPEPYSAAAHDDGKSIKVVISNRKSSKRACCHARGRAPLGSVPTMAVVCASCRCPARASPGVPHACTRVPTSVRELGRTGGAG